jgi:hypothetical protein
MKDYLLDIVQHTYGLGNIDLVKVTGDASSTAVSAIAEDRSVVVEATFKNPNPDFIGTFGMPNLSKLNTILSIPEYKDGAKLSINTQQDSTGATVPCGVHFENANGDFKNDYRFMVANVINEKLKSVKFRGAKWNVDIVPSNASIQRMKFMASANNEVTSFIAKTENGALKFFFGDASSHAGNFVFDNNVAATLSRAWAWPTGVIINIFSLPGDKTFKISDEGAVMITVDSGLAVYNYIITAQSK